MILPQPFNEYLQIFSDPETHKLTYDVTVESMKELQDIVTAQNSASDFHLNGILLVIVKEEQVKKFKQYCEVAESLGIPVEFWDKERTINEIGTDVYHASIFEPNGGEVHPMKLVYALKKAAEDVGVKIYERSPVFEVTEGEVIDLSVGEERYTVKTRAIVLSTNGYTSKLNYFKNRIFAFHAQVAITPPLGKDVFTQIGWKRKIPFSDTMNYLYHLGTTADNRILIGGGNADYFFNNGLAYKRDIREIYVLLKKELTRIYPPLSDVEFEYIWNGVLGFSLDFNQSVGVMGKHRNIYYGLAYCGHGVNLSFLFGKIIGDLYTGDVEKWKDMPFLNYKIPYLPPEPLRWLGVQAYFSYYKMLDRFSS
jgi:glycine/D-amino acid oxidase-like deaminating enzyme